MDNVPVLGEAGQHVLDTLLEGVDLVTVNSHHPELLSQLRLIEHFSNVKDNPLTHKKFL